MSVDGHRAPRRKVRGDLAEHRLRLERLSERFLREAVGSLDDAYSARMFLYARGVRLIAAGLRLLEKAGRKK